MTERGSIAVTFGGQARELWSDRGLRVTYHGGVTLGAEPGPGGWTAVAPPPAAGGSVKSDMAEYASARELCCRINDGSAPPLTLAYFRAAASAGSAGYASQPPPDGALPLPQVVDGTCDALILPETLRLLLDEGGLGWDEAMESVAGSFIYCPGGDVSPERRLYRPTAPLSAVAALQPRTASLISAVNERLCQTLWSAYPGDWQRIAQCAALRDGEVRFPALSAYMCGLVRCPEAARAGALRAFYTLFPAKFQLTEEDI